MDRSQWSVLTGLIRRVVRDLGPSRRVVFDDALILKMYFWSVAHDRPLSWACDPGSYGGGFRPRRLPSVSPFCRRVKTPRFQQFLQRLHDALTGDGAPAAINFFDGKPLVVGGSSRDPEAPPEVKPATVWAGWTRATSCTPWLRTTARSPPGA